MSVSHGMNIDEVRSLGTQLQTQADAIRTAVAQLEGAINNATWVGPDATTFKTAWWPEKRTLLQQAAEQLHGFGQSAINNANEQEQVSSH
ncbi:hypothetical protein [Blastococcus sp. SYSU D00820]